MFESHVCILKTVGQTSGINPHIQLQHSIQTDKMGFGSQKEPTEFPS